MSWRSLDSLFSSGECNKKQHLEIAKKQPGQGFQNPVQTAFCIFRLAVLQLPLTGNIAAAFQRMIDNRKFKEKRFFVFAFQQLQ